MEHLLETLGVMFEPIFGVSLPFRDRRRKVSQPWEEFDEVTARPGVLNSSVDEVVYLDDSRIVDA